MQYMLFTCGDAAGGEAADPALDGWRRSVEEAGVKRRGARLRPADTARTVRIRAGVLEVTQGPFAASDPQIIGFEVLECADLDQAIELAASHPSAARSKVEIRPFWED